MIVEQYSDDSFVFAKNKTKKTSLAQVKPESSLSGKLEHVAVCWEQAFLNWLSGVEFCMCSRMEFYNKGPEYLIVNFRVFVRASCIK